MRILLISLFTITSQIAFGIPSIPAPIIVTISGHVSDVAGNSLAGATVNLRDDAGTVLYETTTDAGGNFVLSVAKRKYKALMIVKDYKVHYVEFWYWNYFPNSSQKIEAFVDGIELFGMNVWQVTPPDKEGFMAYVRPMSLKLAKAVSLSPSGCPLSTISPNLTEQNIDATVDGQSAVVWNVNRVKEFVDSSCSMDAFLIQLGNVTLGASTQSHRLCLKVRGRLTGEQGMGCTDF